MRPPRYSITFTLDERLPDTKPCPLKPMSMHLHEKLFRNGISRAFPYHCIYTAFRADSCTSPVNIIITENPFRYLRGTINLQTATAPADTILFQLWLVIARVLMSLHHIHSHNIHRSFRAMSTNSIVIGRLFFHFNHKTTPIISIL